MWKPKDDSTTRRPPPASGRTRPSRRRDRCCRGRRAAAPRPCRRSPCPRRTPWRAWRSPRLLDAREEGLGPSPQPPPSGPRGARRDRSRMWLARSLPGRGTCSGRLVEGLGLLVRDAAGTRAASWSRSAATVTGSGSPIGRRRRSGPGSARRIQPAASLGAHPRLVVRLVHTSCRPPTPPRDRFLEEQLAGDELLDGLPVGPGAVLLLVGLLEEPATMISAYLRGTSRR